MEPSKEQKPRPADLSKLNVDDALKVKPIPRAPLGGRNSTGAYMLLIPLFLVAVVGLFIYFTSSNHPAAPPVAMENKPASSDTTGSITPVTPVAPAGGTSTPTTTPQ